MKKSHVCAVIALAAMLVVAWALPSVIHNRVIVVSGSSMLPTYEDGDILLVSPVRTSEDIVAGYPVCWVRLPSGQDVIKRLIGYPGDRVDLVEGATYVNHELVMPATGNCWDTMTFLVQEGQYLFLGDNRSDSLDAREWAEPTVGIECVKGQLPNSVLQT